MFILLVGYENLAIEQRQRHLEEVHSYDSLCCLGGSALDAVSSGRVVLLRIVLAGGLEPLVGPSLDLEAHDAEWSGDFESSKD